MYIDVSKPIHFCSYLFYLKPSSANPTKWSNTLKHFVGNLPANCLNAFDHFVGLALKGLNLLEWHLELAFATGM